MKPLKNYLLTGLILLILFSGCGSPQPKDYLHESQKQKDKRMEWWRDAGFGIDFSNWDTAWYLGEEIHNFGNLHHEVLSLATLKPFLLIGGDSADGEKSRPYIEAVRPIYALYDKKIKNKNCIIIIF